MARMNLITRRVLGTKVSYNYVDLEVGELMVGTITISKAVEDKTKLLKLVDKLVSVEDKIKVCQIVDTERVDKLIGITEEDFIKYGVELDTKTRKPLA